MPQPRESSNCDEACNYGSIQREDLGTEEMISTSGAEHLEGKRAMNSMIVQLHTTPAQLLACYPSYDVQ